MKHVRIPRNEFRRSEYSAFRCLSLNSLPWRSSELVPSQDTTFCACTRGESNSPAVLYSSRKNQWRVTYWGRALARIVLRFITPCPLLLIGIVCFPLFSMFFKENAGLSSYICASGRYIVLYKLCKHAARCANTIVDY